MLFMASHQYEDGSTDSFVLLLGGEGVAIDFLLLVLLESHSFPTHSTPLSQAEMSVKIILLSVQS